MKNLVSLLVFVLGIMASGFVAILVSAITLKTLVYVVVTRWLTTVPELPYGTAVLLLAVLAAGSALSFGAYVAVQTIVVKILN